MPYIHLTTRLTARRRPQKIQTPGDLELSGAGDLYDIELDNGAILNQATEISEAGIPDDTEASISAQAKELPESTSNEDTLDSPEIERVHNSATARQKTS